MPSQFRLRNVSSWTMFIFGALALLLGAVGILSPEALLGMLNFEVLARESRAAGDYSVTFLTASSMASFNMGVYYVLAALTNWQPFYRWTVPFRCVTFVVFTLAVVRGLAPVGFMGVAAWELVGALATGAALVYEQRRSTSA